MIGTPTIMRARAIGTFLLETILWIGGILLFAYIVWVMLTLAGCTAASTSSFQG